MLNTPSGATAASTIKTAINSKGSYLCEYDQAASRTYNCYHDALPGATNRVTTAGALKGFWTSKSDNP